ncbi:hypothetical protein C0Q64_11970 [Streptomyces albidoflavus]|nr:hypothetical protein C0Q64_11970 [Streptomyces albidoflavus]RZE02972.1 hypothetical protein C0Q65_12295 [Streptomyces albidoflavus]
MAVEPVGLTRDGSIGLPEDAQHAGWYTGSPTPGQNGNAVLVGHVDSATGPAAFYGLSALRTGDAIVVERLDGRPAHYTVSSLTVHPKDGFPADQVYRPTLTPRLTLITCADWDPDDRTYRSNLVLTAVLSRG